MKRCHSSSSLKVKIKANIGNFDKLGKMLKLAHKLKDPVSRLNNALMLGDAK
jgi:hypothetical protein